MASYRALQMRIGSSRGCESSRHGRQTRAVFLRERRPGRLSQQFEQVICAVDGEHFVAYVHFIQPQPLEGTLFQLGNELDAPELVAVIASKLRETFGLRDAVLVRERMRLV